MNKENVVVEEIIVIKVQLVANSSTYNRYGFQYV